MDFEKFLMVFLRLSVLIPLLPVIGARSVPVQFKVGMILGLAYFLTPLVTVSLDGPLYFRIGRELLLGAAIGFCAQLVFTSVIMAGQWISFNMGLTVASIFDPTIGGQASPLTQFMNFLAIAAFFAFDLHHQLIVAIVETFQAVPSAGTLAAGVLEVMKMLFIVAFKLSLPILLVLVMSNLVLGFLAKALPQANLLVMGLPLNMGLGFLGLALFLPFLIHLIGQLEFIPAWR